MPAEQLKSASSFDISPVSDQELKQSGVGKMLIHRCEKAEQECQLHIVQINLERSRREDLKENFHRVDSQCKVLQAKLEVLNNRDAISQVLYLAVAVVTALLIDFSKTAQWLYGALCLAADLLLVVAVLLVHGYKKKARDGVGEASMVGKK